MTNLSRGIEIILLHTVLGIERSPVVAPVPAVRKAFPFEGIVTSVTGFPWYGSGANVVE